MSQKLKFDSLKLILKERVKTDIIYHTEDELKELLRTDIISILKENNLFSDEKTMNTLELEVTYHRNFVGDLTTFSTDSLRYPYYDYSLKVMDSNKTLTTISEHDLTYKGGLLMNLQIIAGTARDKSYELDFVKALAEKIIAEIKRRKA